VTCPARRTGLAALLTALTALTACAPSSAAHEPSWLPRDARLSAPSTAEWRAARRALAELREQSRSPRTLQIALTLREPTTGRVLEARGAAALAPPDALRMILLGPGGTTALDLWIKGERYRFAVPAIELTKRGDTRAPAAERRGLPVDFLRAFLLRPAEGQLLWAEREGTAMRYLLRDGETLVDLRSFEHKRIEMRRSTWTSERPGAPVHLLDRETVSAAGLGCAEVRYRQASTGLEVHVRCEGERAGTPNPRAFADPDAAEEVP
jgi:hypothetical protein